MNSGAAWVLPFQYRTVESVLESESRAVRFWLLCLSL